MTTIHVDTGALRQVQRQISAVQAEVRQALRSLDGVIGGLPGCWRAPSADEFLREYEGRRAALERVLSDLSHISAEISAAIRAWEQAARDLG